MNWDMNSDEDLESAVENLEPSDFYFQMIEDQELGFCFLITPKEFFDTNECLYDGYIPEDKLPEGFCDITEATYEYEGEPQEGRQLLLDAGFIEKKMFEE